MYRHSRRTVTCTTFTNAYMSAIRMLENKSVRETVGQHWKDWVCQKDTRLANARDLAKDRGLTRAEVTFYCKHIVPSDKFMEDGLQRLTKYVPSTLVYSTPFADTWKAYCDAMLHSLVVVDRTRDVGLIVYTYNEMTKNISGQLVEHWSEKEQLAILKVERTVVQIYHTPCLQWWYLKLVRRK